MFLRSCCLAIRAACSPDITEMFSSCLLVTELKSLLIVLVLAKGSSSASEEGV